MGSSRCCTVKDKGTVLSEQSEKGLVGLQREEGKAETVHAQTGPASGNWARYSPSPSRFHQTAHTERQQMDVCRHREEGSKKKQKAIRKD